MPASTLRAGGATRRCPDKHRAPVARVLGVSSAGATGNFAAALLAVMSQSWPPGMTVDCMIAVAERMAALSGQDEQRRRETLA